ncbi:ATP-binding cassette domain-containing protein [bacterium]
MIKFKNISKDFGLFSIEDINLEINNSEYFVFLGPTGAGKTILLELIAGILLPDKGQIFIDDNDITKVPPYKRNISMVYQNYMLFPHYTVEENITYGLKLQKKPKQFIDDKLKYICDLFNILHILKRYPQNLSGGEKQRTALARALVCEPKIILLDEPFAALDVMTKEIMIKEIRNIHKNCKTTFVHVTHDLEEAIALSDKAAVLNNGKLEQVGSTLDVFKKPTSHFTAEFVGTKNIFQGDIYEEEEKIYCNINNVDISLVTDKRGENKISIRPEDIIIANSEIASSARNIFSGIITDILFKQYMCEITVDIGIAITAFITYTSHKKLELQIGKKVWTIFKSMEVHVI